MYYQPPCSLYTHTSATGYLSSSYTTSLNSNSVADQTTVGGGGALRTGPSSSSIGLAVGSTADGDKEIKSQFISPEGVYKMTVSELYRPSLRTPLNSATLPASNAPVRVSFLRVYLSKCTCNEGGENLSDASNGDRPLPTNSSDTEENEYVERICFNVGREIYVYDYSATHQPNSDLSKPVDKRIYKGTFPTCHDFNHNTATVNSCSLIIGFSAGQVQMIDPYQKEYQSSKLFNEDRLVDKTSVTCLRWVPGESSLFIASHASGNLYVYNEEFTHCPQVGPTFQLLKQGDGYSVFTSKSKTQRNPIAKWQIGEGSAINQFEFNNGGGDILAVVGQDGFLRIFNYKSMELLGYFKSYFGGLLCLAWSPDNELIATGGEDDMLTVYSVREKRVFCRGQGHKSWISQVAFDEFRRSGCDSTIVRVPSTDLTPDDRVEVVPIRPNQKCAAVSRHRINGSAATRDEMGTDSNHANSVQQSQWASFSASPLEDDEMKPAAVSYRVGSVGHDTQLCLWDLPLETVKDNLPSCSNGASEMVDSEQTRPPPLYSIGNMAGNTTVISIEPVDGREKIEKASPNSTATTSQQSAPDSIALRLSVDGETGVKGGSSTLPASGKSKLRKLHKRGLSFGSRFTGITDRSARNASTSGNQLNGKGQAVGGNKDWDLPSRIFGTAQCPRMDDIPLIEPIVCKKIAHERVTVLHFREECLVTASQDGFICTWARPGERRRGNANGPFQNSV